MIIFLIFFITTNLFSEWNWDGRYYHQSFLNFFQNNKEFETKYFGLNVLDLKIDNRVNDNLRVKSEI